MKQVSLVYLITSTDRLAAADRIAELEVDGFVLFRTEPTYMVFVKDTVQEDLTQRSIDRLEIENKNLMGTSYLSEVLELRTRVGHLEVDIEELEDQLRLERLKTAINTRHVERIDPKYKQWNGPREDFYNK